MKISIPLDHLYNLNKKLVSYKKNDDLTEFINKNEQYLNQEIISEMTGGAGDIGTRETGNTSPSPDPVETKHINLREMKKTVEDLLTRATAAHNKSGHCDNSDYIKVIKYLMYNITMLAVMFPSEKIEKIRQQITEINNLITNGLEFVS